MSDTAGPRIVVGLDNGGTTNNATVIDWTGRFLVEQMVEVLSRVREGPAVALASLEESLVAILAFTGTDRRHLAAVGLDTPGPASADGVISSKGSTNFVEPAWRGFDIRSALEARIGVPVVYLNDGNAAALYAHHRFLGDAAATTSSVSAVVGTGLGGGLVERGRVIGGAAGMAGELGHVHIPMHGLLEDDQPVPSCNCGFAGDVESVASLTGIERNLLPYWLSRFPDHELASAPPAAAARLVRGLGERGDAMATRIFEQQAMALGRLFTIVANVTDPAVYLVGGGVVEAAPHFRDWFVETVRAHTTLREEQARVARFALVPDRDMAGARGAAIAALEQTRRG